ncbi:MAG: T9SS type A sorting domain-containing protein [Chitinophagales bacterium]|nr:T9SS type A sorting domain-containing protein [Chitinophagales bacterium]
MKKLLLLLSGFIFTCTSYASHFSGGEIRYEFNGTNYDVYLSLYKICEGGASLTNAATINVSSVSQTYNANVNLTFLGFDTVNVSCPLSASRCINPTSAIPGYITARFKGTMSLPTAATDWVVSYTSAARISSLVNLNSGASAQMYLYTNIDNSTAINSNPLMASSPSYFMLVNTPTIIPLQAIDPEGDALVYDLVAPLTASGSNATYAAGYSATAPLGSTGTATINTTNNTLTLNSPATGTFAIGLRVREYRNSVLVGEYIREFTLAVMPGTGSGITIPAPTSTTSFTYYTCPGQTTNSIVLNFVDPTSTDSVYLDVTTPTLSGWTFSTSVTPGIPSASATINWTTPGTLNPATLPHFFIKVRARDNGCPKAVADYAVVVRTRQCTADSVWPGDANGDFTVNIYDPLAIAIAAGQTGPTRPGASTSWTAQACPNWANSFVTNNTNMKHADCNGDGTVNSSDLAAVTANYSLSHPKGGRSKTTGANDLYFDMTGVNMAPGAYVSIPIKLGSSTQTISNVYAIATQVQLNGLSLSTAPAITNNNSWLDNGSNAINFSYGASATAVDWVLGRTNQQNVSGQGTIGTLNFMVPATAKIGDNFTLSFTNTVLIDKDGAERYDINQVDATGAVQQSNGIAGVAARISAVSIVPNPSGNTAYLNMSLKADADVNVTVLDVTGKVVWSVNDNYTKGEQSIALPAGNLAGGMYMVRLSTGEGNASVMKWIKQ